MASLSNNPIQEATERIAIERAKFIDDTINRNVPSWKLNLLKKFNYTWLKKVIRADIEIITQALIADFGNETIILLNGKVIGRYKYSI